MLKKTNEKQIIKKKDKITIKKKLKNNIVTMII